ncbi:MAG: hypothetical protein AAB131_04685 [Actinomycetota bacterium]|jgi:hypothetical protein
MIVLPLLVVLVAVAVVHAMRHRHAPAMTAGSTQVSANHAARTSAVGRWSLIVLGVGLVLWTLTRTTLPIYFAASIGAIAFVRAIVAVVQSNDRSPLLLIPLLFVPLAAAASATFVLLQ